MNNKSMSEILEKNVQRNPRVLLISEGTIPSVLLCGKFQLEHLERTGKIEYKYSMIYWASPKLFNWADVVVFIRPSLELEQDCISKLKETGRKVIVVMDDDLLNVPSTFSSYDHYHGKEKIMLDMIKQSDLFLTPSRNLMKKYGVYSNQAALIEEPTLGCECNHNENEVLKIGFAGSVDRTSDLNTILRDVVERVSEKYKSKVTFEFFGAKPEFAEKYGFRHIPYTDSYENYCKIMSELNWDIGLAPMAVTEFNKYKHYNKFVEYSSYGIVGVYTQCEPYIWAIENGKNGLLCTNDSDSWFRAISMLIENSELRNSIKYTCLNQAKTIYSLEKVSDDYLNLINRALGDDWEDSEKSEVKSLFLKEVAFFAERIMVKTKKYGWRTPFVFIQKLRNGVFSNK